MIRSVKANPGKPMTSQEEAYVHFASCMDDLNYAWRILNQVRDTPGSLLAGAAFRFALVAYARPYKASRGSLGGSHKLDQRFVPTEHQALHWRILQARDQIQAHSDLTVKDAKLHVAKLASGRFVGVAQNIISGLEERPNIDSIITLIELTLDQMYGEAERLEAALPVNS